jgi:tetratricopeptide (TPR) repeat protein
MKRGEPAVRGTLSSDPLARLLASLAAEGATGTLELLLPTGATAQLLLVQGELAKIKTPTPLYLGAIAYELGLASADDLNKTLLDVARSKRLHGAVLLERGLINEKQLRHCLAVQAARKLHDLFTSPLETTFEFHPYQDNLASFGGGDGPRCDLRPSIWYGIRAFPPMWHVEAVLAATMPSRLRLFASENLQSLGLDDEETLLAQTFRGKAKTLAEFTAGTSPNEQKRRQLLCYFLLLMGSLVREAAAPKQAESGVRQRVASYSAPPDAEAASKLFERAYLASQSGQVEVAEALCRHGLEVDPAHVNLASLRVWLAALRPDGQSELATQRAISDLSAIVGAHDECVHAHFFRGQLYKRLGRHDRAATDFREAVRHDPRRADAQAELRLCVSRMGRR